MGCFNGRCIFSGLPILSGEKAGMILLASSHKRGRSNSLIDTSDMWQPIGLPIYGLYDDYGRIEKAKPDPVAAHLLSTLQLMADAKDFAYDEDFKHYHAKEATAPIRLNSIEAVFENVQEERLRHRTLHYQLGYAIFHPDWWQKMLAIYDAEMAGRPGRDRKEKKYINRFMDDADTWLEWATEKRKLLDAAKRGTQKASMLWLELSENQMEERDNQFVAFFRQSERYPIKEVYLPSLNKPLPAIGSPAWAGIKKALAELCIVEWAMETVGKFWLPFSSAGQGHVSVRGQLLYAEELLKATKAVDKSNEAYSV